MNKIEELAEEVRNHPDYEKWKRRPKWVNFLVLILSDALIMDSGAIGSYALYKVYKEADLI